MTRTQNTKQIHFKVSNDEYNEFVKKASDCGLTITEFFKQSAKSIEITPYKSDCSDGLIAIMLLSDYVNSIKEDAIIKDKLKGACNTLWQFLK